MTGFLTGDEALTFWNVLDAVTILVMVLVVLTCRTYTQEIKQKGLIYIQVNFMVESH